MGSVYVPHGGMMMMYRALHCNFSPDGEDHSPASHNKARQTATPFRCFMSQAVNIHIYCHVDTRLHCSFVVKGGSHVGEARR